MQYTVSIMRLLFFSLALYISSLATVARAQEFSAPDKAHRETMSYEEYSKLREQMRTRMEKMTPEERSQKPEIVDHRTEYVEHPKSDSTYGKGYHSRSRPEDRPDIDTSRRTERPRFERFKRGDRLRR